MLFEKYKLKNIELRNRIVMAPMTRSMSPENIPGQDVAEYYERRAKGEVGLIITEGIEVSHIASSSYPNVPRLDTEKSRDAWKLVVSKIKENGGSVIAQLWHSGAMRKIGMNPDPDVPGYTPSGLRKGLADEATAKNIETIKSSSDTDKSSKDLKSDFSFKNRSEAHEVTQDDIKILVDAFGQDAKWCEEIGFDGIEIHGAHGYLVDNFFWETLNRRNDKYGGSIRKRSQFAKEVTESIRSNVSDKFIVGLRFSQWKQQDFEARLARNPQELEELLMPIVSSGLDFLHASNRKFWEPEFEGSDNNLAYWAQKITGLPTITVGSVGLESKGDGFINMTAQADPVSIEKAIQDINERKYDMVAVGRALLADAEWVVKMKEGRLSEIKPYSEKVLTELN
ncbi:MAG: NADH:flavin oxidoreductase [SAR86 cluster bacterium]|nr:NADH:flavin oxidoreductase [SAR86 cluster bacterium]